MYNINSPVIKEIINWCYHLSGSKYSTSNSPKINIISLTHLIMIYTATEINWGSWISLTGVDGASVIGVVKSALLQWFSVVPKSV